MRIKLRLPFVILAIIILFTQCGEDATVARDYPRVNTFNVTNISSAGATCEAEITECGNSPIVEHGFVWSTVKTLSIVNDNRVFLGPFSGTGAFTADISTTLVEGEEYFVSAFLKAGDYVVYGKVVSFISLGSQAPKVTGFHPAEAAWGDTITISGKNFSWLPGSNEIYIGGHRAPYITSISDTALSCIVPSTVVETKNSLSVKLSGYTGTLEGDSLILINNKSFDSSWRD